MTNTSKALITLMSYALEEDDDLRDLIHRHVKRDLHGIVGAADFSRRWPARRRLGIEPSQGDSENACFAGDLSRLERK